MNNIAKPGKIVIISLLICFGYGHSAFSQDYKALIDSVATDSTRHNSFAPLPFIFYTPETNLFFSFSGIYTFYADPKDRTTRPSIIAGTGIYTLKKQFISNIYLNRWSKGNKNHYLVELTYIKFNYLYYGIGNQTLLKDEQKINEDRFEFVYSSEHKLLSGLYVGIEAQLKKEKFYGSAPTAIYNNTYPNASAGGLISRIGASIIYDTRNTYTYPTSGAYYKAIYSHTLPKNLSDFNFHRIKLETRNFITMQKKHTIGFHSYFESIQGDLPFFELPQMGNQYIMRGYYTGRFRDQNLAASQVEYRLHFTEHWAVAFFGGTGGVFNNNSLSWSTLKPNYGTGFRYLLDKDSGLHLRLDVGFGEKRPGEGIIWNPYFFIGEAF